VDSSPAAQELRQLVGRVHASNAPRGPAHVLVNNAGLMLLGPFGPDRREDHRRMIEVNLLGAITVTEVFLDQLKAGGRGTS
jgi:NAD(P)-dependent dehydrogenase (short-subunit alcohol dehydrogenase family)